MPIPLERFVETVKKSQLVSEAELQLLVDGLGSGGVDELAELLLADNLVSQWQIEQLRKGRYKGFLLGDYTLLDLIGAGGMSKVFRARRKGETELLALKVLPLKKLEAHGRLQRFFDEAQAACRLEHPNIVRTDDFDKGGPPGAEAYYLVMELLAGRNFGELVEDEGPLDFVTAAGLIKQACQGLNYAHVHDLVHRDVKPTNFMVTESNDVKLLDLGLVLNSEKNGDAAAGSGPLVGTVDYLSPEQSAANGEVDARSDIFSLGGVFYFLLTGRSPFHEGSPAERLALIQNNEPPRIEDARPETPEALVEIIGRMLCRDRQQRFETAAEVADAIGVWLAGESTEVVDSVDDDLFDSPESDDDSLDETSSPDSVDSVSFDFDEPVDPDTATLVLSNPPQPVEPSSTEENSPMADKKEPQGGLPDFEALSRMADGEAEPEVEENPFARLDLGGAPAAANPFEAPAEKPASKPAAKPAAKPAKPAAAVPSAAPKNAPTASAPAPAKPAKPAVPAAKPAIPVTPPAAEEPVIDASAFQAIEEVEDVEDIEEIEDVEDIEEVVDVEDVEDVEDIEEVEDVEEEPVSEPVAKTEKESASTANDVIDVDVPVEQDTPTILSQQSPADMLAAAAESAAETSDEEVVEVDAGEVLTEGAAGGANDSVMLFNESGPIDDVDYLPESTEPDVVKEDPELRPPAATKSEEPESLVPVGIDLGTTYSVVAYVDTSGRPWTLTNAEGDITTPSVVFFENGKAIVGKEAIKAAEYEPEGVARYAKRNMGEALFEREVRGENLPPEVLQAMVLQKLKSDAELKLGPFRKAVVTVPAYFNEPRRKATQDAGRLAGLDVLDIINEPTAAAICYGVQQGFLNNDGEASDDELILVYDLGGGTFDVTLMEISGSDYKTIATGGDVQLGGVDWDMRLVDHIAAAFLEEHNVDIREDAGALQAALAEASDAKHALTARDEVTIHFAYQGNRMRIPLTREEFENASGDLLDRTLFTTNRVLREAKKEWAGITRLLLVGGSTRMPMVQDMLERESGLKVDRSLSPDEAVAHGAAIYASLLLAKDEKPLHDISVSNVNSHDLGVLGRESATGMPRRHVLIAKNSQLPASGVGKFVTSKPNQKSVKVEIIEGGDKSGKNATQIGKCVVTDLPPNLPAKTKVVVKFTYGTDGRLKVEASVPKTNSKAKMNIERKSGLSEKLLKDWEAKIAAGEVVGAG